MSERSGRTQFCLICEARERRLASFWARLTEKVAELGDQVLQVEVEALCNAFDLPTEHPNEDVDHA